MRGRGPEFSTVVLMAGKAAAEVKGGEQRRVWSDSFGTGPRLPTDWTRNQVDPNRAPPPSLQLLPGTSSVPSISISFVKFEIWPVREARLPPT